MILGLDLASTTGVATMDIEGRLHDTWRWFIAPRSGEQRGARYLRLREHLERTRDIIVATKAGIYLVIYEAAHHRGGAPTEYAIGCATTVQAWCAEHDLRFASVHSRTLKRFAVGKGNADKELVLEEARRRWGRTFILDDNIADAAFCAEYGRVEVLGHHRLQPTAAEAR